MEKLSEKFQEELWSKMKPFLEWHRFIIFMILNFSLSFNFFYLFIEALETKTLHDITEVLFEMSRELKIKDFLFSAFVAFYFSPWLSSKLNWILLNKFHFGLSKPLRKSVQDFAEKIASSKNGVSSETMSSILKKEVEAVKRFRLLKMLTEICVVLIPIAYLHLLEPSYGNIILSLALVVTVFYGISLMMMIIFLRDIVPGVIIRQFDDFKKYTSS